MPAIARLLLWALLVGLPGAARAAEPEQAAAEQAAAEEKVVATVESTLRRAGGQIRQFAFDGDENTYFASAEHASAADRFTLKFDQPVTAASLVVTTGRPDGADRLEGGVLEGSADGQQFEPLATFVEGVARCAPNRPLAAVRIQPGADLEQPLVVREIALDSSPPVAIFRYPIEIDVDVSDAPELQSWAERVARICERNYPMICDELSSDGFRPRTVISMSLKSDYRGVAAASGGRITGSVSYFKNRPDDVGAMIHETVHCVQAYRSRNNPGWLVEGVADYIRFFKYEPGNLGRINVQRARYDGNYRVSAAFLAYVAEQYDKDLVRKLNQAMRAGEYRETIWETLTNNTVEELDRQWRASLRAGE